MKPLFAEHIVTPPPLNASTFGPGFREAVKTSMPKLTHGPVPKVYARPRPRPAPFPTWPRAAPTLHRNRAGRAPRPPRRCHRNRAAAGSGRAPPRRCHRRRAGADPAARRHRARPGAVTAGALLPTRPRAARRSYGTALVPIPAYCSALLLPPRRPVPIPARPAATAVPDAATAQCRHRIRRRPRALSPQARRRRSRRRFLSRVSISIKVESRGSAAV
jgi:hypothetical protein